MIEKTMRGVAPHATITAPVHLPRDYHEESVRLATFEKSKRAVRNRIVKPTGRPLFGGGK